MHEFGDRERDHESLLPPAKRTKIGGNSARIAAEETETTRERKTRRTTMPEFRAETLDDFYKPCPNYRLPAELGAFSFDDKGVFQHDRSQLRYYNPPNQPSRLSMDLKVGYDGYVPKEKSGSPDLGPILRWISLNGHCFRPRNEPLSPNNGTSAGRASAAGETAVPTRFNETRPDNLLTNFVVWRGMLCKMLCSLYNQTEPWKVAATLYNGTVYLQEIETEEKRRQEAIMPPQQRATCYWGLKFEDYVTSRDPPAKVGPQSPTVPQQLAPGTVNPHRAFSSVVRTRMNSHSIVMVGEVDCCEHNSKEKSPQSYVELKTSRIILTDRNKASFRRLALSSSTVPPSLIFRHSCCRHKLMKWWAQSFLIGVPKLVCGFRNDDGIIKSLQSFRISDIPKETQVENHIGLISI
jgi:RAT1-interacting protein